MLAFWSLVPLPFLNLAWTSGSLQFMYCWSLAWRIFSITMVSLVAQLVKNLPVIQESWVQSLGWEDSPGEEKGYPLHYSGLKNSKDCIVHGVTKSLTRLSDFHFSLASMWDKCNCVIVWTFFGIAFLWYWKENWPFSVLWPLLSFPDLLAFQLRWSLNADGCPQAKGQSVMIKQGAMHLV